MKYYYLKDSEGTLYRSNIPDPLCTSTEFYSKGKWYPVYYFVPSSEFMKVGEKEVFLEMI